MKPPLPSFDSDEAAEHFVATADLSDYDLSAGRLVTFEIRPKDTSISLRLPGHLLEAVRHRAKSQGLPYQRYIRLAIERALKDEGAPI
jgi:predicted DNA binding CopG/RHH family protein